MDPVTRRKGILLTLHLQTEISPRRTILGSVAGWKILMSRNGVASSYRRTWRAADLSLTLVRARLHAFSTFRIIFSFISRRPRGKHAVDWPPPRGSCFLPDSRVEEDPRSPSMHNVFWYRYTNLAEKTYFTFLHDPRQVPTFVRRKQGVWSK